MQRLLMALLVTCLPAAPSFGVINVKITADEVNVVGGQTTTIRIWAQGTSAGIYSLAGDIVATYSGFNTENGLTAKPGSFTWANGFSPTSMLIPKIGAVGFDGGWTNFGSVQTNYLSADPTYGKADYVQVASYTVTDNPVCDGTVTLTFVPKAVSGFKPLEVDKTAIIGQNIPVTLLVGVPEPMTLALLALAGLAATRRRR